MDNDSPSSPDQDKAPEQASGLGMFWAELRRRKVVRVAVTYAVVGWIVMQVAGLTFEGFGIPIWAFRFVMLCVILGFPIAVIIAWAFELTPDGIKTTKAAQTSEASTEEHIAHTKKRNWVAYAMGAVIPTLIFGTLALFFYIRSSSGPQTTVLDKSIAVLPFDNRSNIEEDQFFTDGIHDDLLTLISRIRDIRTTSRTSVVAYKGTDKNMKTIGEELGVKWLLEGGVQRGGDQIRINAQLIEAATDTHLWAETYTEELTAKNIFNIQSEIATNIADALKAVLSPEEKGIVERLPTSNMEALEAYFRGKEGFVNRTTESYQNSIAHFEEAISRDPDFALAHLKLGMSLLNQSTALGLSRDEQVAKAEPHILKALKLDDTLSEAYRALGVLSSRKGNREAAEMAYQKAIELDPNNSLAYDAYENLVRRKTGPSPQTADLLRKAYDADPKDSSAKDRLAESYEALGQWDKALEIRQSFAAEFPDSGAVLRDLGILYLYRLGRIDDGLITYRKLLALDPAAQTTKLNLSNAFLSFGDTERAIWWIDGFLESEQATQRQADWRARKFKLQGDDKARERVVLAALSKYPESSGLLYHLTDIYLASGQPEELRSHWERAYPSLFEPRPRIDWIDRWEAKDLARVLKATGEEKQANLLIDNLLTLLNSVRAEQGNIQLEAILYAVRGDDQQALGALGRFFDAGGSPYELEWQDELKLYLNNLEYIAMAEKRKAELAIQLERIRKMDAAGQLAPIPEHLRD